MASATSVASASSSRTSDAVLMFLKTENKIIEEEVRKRLDPDRAPPPAAADIRVGDFDGTHFRIEVPEDNLDILRISMLMPFWDDLKNAGVDEHLRSVYGSLLVTPKDGANVALEFNVKTPPMPAAQLVSKVSNLRRNAMAAPFQRAFAAVASGAGAKTPPMTVRFRANEPIYILPRPDRVSVIYALEFADVTDRAIARVVAQEFAESQRLISAAPPASFSEREPPMELRGMATRQTENFVGYLSFAVFPRHFDSDVRRENAINMLTQFRMYLQYHLKTAKSYLHARMRARVDGWLQVLNRAVPEDPYAARDKKLASGKTFVRKP